MIVTGDAAHVVMDGRGHRQRLLGQVDACKDLAAFGNARKTLTEHFGIDVVEVQEDMVAIRPYAAPFAHFQRHRAGNDVAARQILGRRGIAFHEPLAFGVGEVATLPARAFGDEHARAVDTGRMELHEFHVLHRQACAQHHAAAIAGARMRRRRGVVAATIATRGQHDGLATKAMDRAIVQTHRNDAAADLAVGRIVHNQVEREIFDKEVCVVLQALLVERVQHRVAGAVCGSAGALDRRTFTHILHVPAEGPLVDRAVVVAAEGHAGMLELVNRLRRFAHEVFYRVLIAQPVRTLDGVVHVPRPMVGRVIAEAGGNTALRRHRVRAGGKHLRDAGRLQTDFRAAHGRTKARSTRAHYDRVVNVINNRIAAPADLEGLDT